MLPGSSATLVLSALVNEIQLLLPVVRATNSLARTVVASDNVPQGQIIDFLHKQEDVVQDVMLALKRENTVLRADTEFLQDEVTLLNSKAAAADMEAQRKYERLEAETDFLRDALEKSYKD